MQSEFFNIEIRNLSIGYKKNGRQPFILREGISFTARYGEMVALIGGNGIGKSTLLRSLAGFQDFFEGDFFINEKSIHDILASERAKLISFVSTEIIQVANMTVFDLVAYGRFPYTNWFGKMTQTDRRVVDDAILSVGMKDFASRQVAQISDGERQRVMIARALAQDTPIIFLDEPTAFLDVSNKYEIFHLLQLLAKDKGKTIVFSTHDLNIALREADKFWILLDIENFEGSPEDAVLGGAIQNLFGNSRIGFDLDEGEYYFKKEFREKVKITGNGAALKWTYRAFNRMGYQIVLETKPDFEVHVYYKGNQAFWYIENRTGTATFYSLYELCRALRENKS